jgi:hypothetical protein
MMHEAAMLAELVTEVLPIVEREHPALGKKLEAALLALRRQFRPLREDVESDGLVDVLGWMRSEILRGDMAIRCVWDR